MAFLNNKIRRAQAIAIGLALLLVGSLYALPKVLVNDKHEAPTEATAAANHLEEEEATDVHNRPLPVQTTARIEEWQRAYNQSGGDKRKKRIFADSLASAYRRTGRPDSAAAWYERIAEADPTVATWLLTGDAYYEAFGFAANVEKMGQLGNKSRQYYEKVLLAQPDNLDVKSKLAMTYVGGPDPMRPVLTLREVLAKNPNHEGAQFNLGLLSMQSGQYDKAIGRFETLLKANPKNTAAMLYLGISYAETKNTAIARKWLLAAKTADPDPALQATATEYLNRLK